jgi:hypothetical protein
LTLKREQPRKEDSTFASMEMCMSKVAEKMVESPSPEKSTELAEPPQVVKVVKSRGGKRRLLTAFGDVAWTRERSPDGGAGSLVLPSLRLQPEEAAMCTAEDKCKAAKGTENDKAAVSAEDKTEKSKSKRPCATLRMSVRVKKKEYMDGGSSTHNSVTLERELSQMLLPEDLDTETMFSVDACLPPCGLRTPPRSVCRLELDVELSPLKGLKLFDRFELLDEDM